MLQPNILLYERHLLTAYPTPACSKLQHDHLPTKFRKGNAFPIRQLHCKIRSHLPYLNDAAGTVRHHILRLACHTAHSKQTENQKSYFFHLIQSSIIELGKIPYNEKNPKHFIKSSFGILLSRYLADSNCRTRFCRPLTKPLIQGTNSYKNSLFLVCGCKGNTFFETTNYPQQLFFFFFAIPLHSARSLPHKLPDSHLLIQLPHGLPFSFT